jgi:hypothetical protein
MPAVRPVIAQQQVAPIPDLESLSAPEPVAGIPAPVGLDVGLPAPSAAPAPTVGPAPEPGDALVSAATTLGAGEPVPVSAPAAAEPTPEVSSGLGSMTWLLGLLVPFLFSE